MGLYRVGTRLTRAPMQTVTQGARRSHSGSQEGIRGENKGNKVGARALLGPVSKA